MTRIAIAALFVVLTACSTAQRQAWGRGMQSAGQDMHERNAYRPTQPVNCTTQFNGSFAYTNCR